MQLALPSPFIAGSALYRKLQGYMMTEEQFQEHGYPRPNPEAAGRAVIHNLPLKKANTDGELSAFCVEMTSVMPLVGCRSNFCAPPTALNKVCCRCGAEYKINAKGSCVRKEECSFHWGRLRKHKGYIVIKLG